MVQKDGDGYYNLINGTRIYGMKNVINQNLIEDFFKTDLSDLDYQMVQTKYAQVISNIANKIKDNYAIKSESANIAELYEVALKGIKSTKRCT